MPSDEFQPDWRLPPPDALAVHIKIALHRRGVSWGDKLSTDEQWRQMCVEIISGIVYDRISPMMIVEIPRTWDSAVYVSPDDPSVTKAWETFKAAEAALKQDK